MADKADALKAAMLAPRPQAKSQRDVPLDNIGTVTIRALTRDEIHFVNDKGGNNVRELEAHTLSLAMVVPALDVAEVRKWMEVAPAGEFVMLMQAVQELSGVDEGAQKRRIPPVRGSRKRS